MLIPFLDLKANYSSIKPEIDEAIHRTLESGWFILGKEVEAFEAEFAAYCGTKYCIGVGNGLEALHLILRGYGIGAGDEVIVPANTYIATALAVSYARAKPVLVDAGETTYNIDVTKIGVNFHCYDGVRVFLSLQEAFHFVVANCIGDTPGQTKSLIA